MYIRNVLVFLLFAILGLQYCNGQATTVVIKGRILERNTNKPIEYASIYFPEKGSGTTTNEEGLFKFNTDLAKPNDSIQISMIGYASIMAPIKSDSTLQTFYLTELVSELQEVLVTSKKVRKTSARKLVQKAYRNIHLNYPSQQYYLEAFVRDLQIEDGEYVQYSESAVKLKYLELSKKIEPAVELLGIRNSLIGSRNSWNETQERQNAIIDILEDDLIRFSYGPIKGTSKWKYSISSILPYKNRYIYEIKCVHKPYQTATLFIDSETFAFLKIELNRSSKDGKFWRRRMTNGAQQTAYHLVCTFQEYKGKMYLKYQKEEDYWDIYESLTSDKLLFTKNPKKELFVNAIIEGNAAGYTFKQNMDKSTSLEDQNIILDDAFWNTYNAPLQTKKLSALEAELSTIKNN